LEQKLAAKERQYDDLKSLAAASHAKYIQLERHFLSKEEHYERRCRELEEANQSLCSHIQAKKQEQHQIDLRPFALFAERLLMMNRVWQQEKNIGSLRTSLVVRKKALNENAFEGFRDRLLLSNVIWRQQFELGKIKMENQRLRQNMIRGITKAAKQMVLDTRREGLIEEFVKDLIDELDAGKKALAVLKDQHEQDVMEINGD
ncbi:hypothetical protein MPER_16065, partial [Moniliophthora perniciosa FA553]